MSKILTTSDICSIGEIGEVVWLECYFDGHTSLQPFMFDIGFTQQSMIINGNNYFCNNWENEVKEAVKEMFAEKWRDKRYRWWDSKPTDEEMDMYDEWEYISTAPI